VDRITSVELLDRGYEHPQPDYFSRDWTQVRISCDVFCPAACLLRASAFQQIRHEKHAEDQKRAQ
jgi:hypothetical protein